MFTKPPVYPYYHNPDGRYTPVLTHLGYSTKEIKQHEMKDDDLKILHNWLNSELSEADLTGPTVRSYWSMKEHIRDVQGVLYYRWEDTVNPRWK